MAEPAHVRSNDKKAADKAPEQEVGLSARILGLISAAKLEERRRARGKRSGPTGERRRRTDLSEPK